MRDDEGCQGNPPCQPASAYFSPLSRSIQHPPASSRTKRTPSLHRSPARPAASSLRASHGTFLRSFFSLRASPCAHYRRPSQTNPLAFLLQPSFFLAFRHLAPPLTPVYLRMSLFVVLSNFTPPLFPVFSDEFVLKISFYIVVLYLRCFSFCLFMKCFVI